MNKPSDHGRAPPQPPPSPPEPALASTTHHGSYHYANHLKTLTVSSIPLPAGDSHPNSFQTPPVLSLHQDFKLQDLLPLLPLPPFLPPLPLLSPPFPSFLAFLFLNLSLLFLSLSPLFPPHTLFPSHHFPIFFFL